MKNDSIMLDLKKTNKKIIKLLSSRFKDMKLNITPNQSKILMFLSDNENVSSNDIGKCIHVNKSTLSKMLNSLERNGFIIRKNSKIDTRKKNIILTNKALKIINILKDDAERISKELMINVKKDEYDTFKRVLDKVEMNIERIKL